MTTKSEIIAARSHAREICVPVIDIDNKYVGDKIVEDAEKIKICDSFLELISLLENIPIKPPEIKAFLEVIN